MFEKFTAHARKVMSLARQEAQRLDSLTIGVEHILMGIARETDGKASRALKKLKVNLEKLHKELEGILVPSILPPPTPGQLQFSTHTKDVIVFADQASILLGQKVIGTEHLLLGIFMGDMTIAARVLNSRGLSLKKVRNTVVALL
jgi:ATP-dependent Clp protease ATP-binding subunit ClpC